MMTGPRRQEWRIAMAQLVVLLYKDQRVATLQKLLNLWIESCDLSESSEDNESNTSPQVSYYLIKFNLTVYLNYYLFLYKQLNNPDTLTNYPFKTT